MGGAKFIFIGKNDADLRYNSDLIKLNLLKACRRKNVK
jgi:hypothetical protein